MAFGDLVRSAQISSNNTGTVSPTLAAGATAGNLLIAAIASAATAAGATWTDPGGWTAIGESGIDLNGGAANVAGKWYYKIAAGGETAVTLATSITTGSRRGVIAEFEGPFSAPPLDVAAENEAAKNTAGTTSLASGTTATTAQAAELAIAFFAADSASNVDGAGTRNYSNSFTEAIFADAVDFAARACVMLAKRVLSATGAYTTTFSVTDTGDEMYGAIATFKQDTGDPPATVLNTADATVFTTATPTVEATATDPDGDTCRYNVQISDNPDAWVSGVQLTTIVDDSQGTGELGVHPQPDVAATTWEGHIQVDDRLGQVFLGRGGYLDHVDFYFGPDEGVPADCDGAYVVRVYDTQGVRGDNVPVWEASTAYSPGDTVRTTSTANADLQFLHICTVGGTSGGSEPTWVETENNTVSDGGVTWEAHRGAGPLNPAAAADTPTPNWIAQSAVTNYNPGAAGQGWKSNTFTGADRIRLEQGTWYCAILDWRPANRTITNTISVKGRLNGTHGGNAYIDGATANNNGPRVGDDTMIRVYEEFVFFDKVSGTDAGFANTVTPADTDPFNSGEKVSYTVQAGEALENADYRWRARAIDPTGSVAYGDWATERTFSVSASAAITRSPDVCGSTIAGLAASVALALGLGLGGLALEGLQPTVTVGDGAVDVPIAVPAGTLTLAGAEPTLTGTATVTPECGALGLTGYEPTILGSNAYSPDVVALTWAGYVPALQTAYRLEPGVVALALGGLAPDVPVTIPALPTTGSLALAGLAPDLRYDLVASPAVGSLALTGATPSLGGLVALETGVAELALTGAAPVVSAGALVAPDVGALTASGVAPAVQLALVASPATGTLALAAYAPSMAMGSVTVPIGALTLTGHAPSIQALGTAQYRQTWLVPARATEWVIPARQTTWIA
jgi:hypothetical protein